MNDFWRAFLAVIVGVSVFIGFILGLLFLCTYFGNVGMIISGIIVLICIALFFACVSQIKIYV
jgi:hypothetical protein